MDILLTSVLLLIVGNAAFAITSAKAAKVKAKADTNSQSSTIVCRKATVAKQHWATYSKQGKIVIFDSSINPLIK